MAEKIRLQGTGACTVSYDTTNNIINIDSATSVAWGNVTNKPTTLSGYGITDAISTSNIGGQSVNYAARAGIANKIGENSFSNMFNKLYYTSKSVTMETTNAYWYVKITLSSYAQPNQLFVYCDYNNETDRATIDFSGMSQGYIFKNNCQNSGNIKAICFKSPYDTTEKKWIFWLKFDKILHTTDLHYSPSSSATCTVYLSDNINSFDVSATTTDPDVNWITTSGNDNNIVIKNATLYGSLSGNVDGNCSGSAGSVAWSNVTNKPTTFNPSTHTHSYTSLTDKPTIPTKTSQLTNDSGFITSDTWRTVQCNGTSIGNNTLNLKAGNNVSLSNSSGTITIAATNTTYSLVGANGTTGLVKNGSSVTSTSGYTACPIISGVPYYKDTNTTYSFSTSNPTLAWGTTSTIGTAGGTTYKVTMPANPNTNYTTGITAGASGTTSNTSTTDPYIKVKDNSTHRSQIRLKGGGSTSVSSDTSGNVTISSTDTNNYVTYFGWSNGTTAGPTATISRQGLSNLSAAIPAAASNLSGVVTTAAQTFAGLKQFNGGIKIPSGQSIDFIGEDNETMSIKEDPNSPNELLIASPTRFSGNIRASSIYASSFYESSDERLKDFHDDLNVSFDDLKKIRKSYFTWKDDDGNTHIGTSAQDVQKIYPELVSEDKNGKLSVDYAKLSIIALAAIDKLDERLSKIEKALNIQ